MAVLPRPKNLNFLVILVVETGPSQTDFNGRKRLFGERCRKIAVSIYLYSVK